MESAVQSQMSGNILLEHHRLQYLPSRGWSVTVMQMQVLVSSHIEVEKSIAIYLLYTNSNIGGHSQTWLVKSTVNDAI